MSMKKHLFCVGAEVRPAEAGPRAREFVSAHLNVYAGANDLREALERAEQALGSSGYEVTFVRGCWVVDAACDDGFCALDEVSSELRGGLLFEDSVHLGELRQVITASDYGY